MDALVCLQPGELRLEHRPDPPLSDGDVLVRPRRIGICGTDYHIFEGTHPFLNYPRVMGHELAVEVVDAPRGSGLTPGQVCVVNPYISCGHCIACRRGKPNCCTRIAVLGVHRDGGMSTLLRLPAANLLAADGLSPDECAAVEFLAIGAHAVRRGNLDENDRVLVVGAGPIGLGVALFATFTKARVWVMDRDEERLRVARSLLDVGTLVAIGDAGQAVRDVTDGDGFDVVFDATGNSKSMAAGFDHVAHGGTYVLVSVVKDSITFSDSDFHRKEMALLGSRNATSTDFNRVMLAMREGQIPLNRLITHRTNLADAIRNLPIWATQKQGLIKAVVTMDA